MSINRIVRVNELLRREIASNLLTMLDNKNVNAATVMISRVETSPDIKHAHVFVSIIGDSEYQRKTLRIVKKLRQALQGKIGKVVSFKFTPKLSFFLDNSIEKGDHVLEMIADMEENHPEWADNNKFGEWVNDDEE